MAGHSQFKNIMHRKGAQDAKRAKVFTKLSKEISVAVKEGGESPDFNPRLRAALMAAKYANMPKDNIEKAIKKANSTESSNFQQITYEGYAPFSVALIVETLTNNRNRTASDVRSIFNKYNGSLGSNGSVSFLFDYMGLVKFKEEAIKFDEIFEVAVNAGAIDVSSEEGEILVFTKPTDLYKVTKSILQSLKLEAELTEFTWLPKEGTFVEVNIEQEDTLLKMLGDLEDNDDVQKVFFNAKIN